MDNLEYHKFAARLEALTGHDLLTSKYFNYEKMCSALMAFAFNTGDGWYVVKIDAGDEEALVGKLNGKRIQMSYTDIDICKKRDAVVGVTVFGLNPDKPEVISLFQPFQTDSVVYCMSKSGLHRLVTDHQSKYIIKLNWLGRLINWLLK